jgi:hypothetical protein
VNAVTELCLCWHFASLVISATSKHHKIEKREKGRKNGGREERRKIKDSSNEEIGQKK